MSTIIDYLFGAASFVPHGYCLDCTRHQGKPRFHIRNNGVGFDMAYADKLFVALHRLHSEAEFQATALGWRIAARIIHRHGGDIWVEASLGKGTTVSFGI